MDTRVADNPSRARYELFADGEPAGFVTYHRRPGRIAFNHTEIDASREGEGLGTALVSAVLDEARAQGLAVLPFCPFVRGYIARHPEYLDLVPEDERGKFDL